MIDMIDTIWRASVPTSRRGGQWRASVPTSRLPLCGNGFRVRCGAPGGVSVCLPADERRASPAGGTPPPRKKSLRLRVSALNSQLSTLNFLRAGTPARDCAYTKHALDPHAPVTNRLRFSTLRGVDFLHPPAHNGQRLLGSKCFLILQ